MSKKIRPVVKIHGGKSYLIDFVISHFPAGYESMTYVEPFCGAASILLNKRKSAREAISDINSGLIAIFKALRDSGDFIDSLTGIGYSEDSFNKALSNGYDTAVNEYVLRRMSRGGLKKAFSWSDRLRGGKPGDVNAWITMLQVLPEIAERIKNVEIYLSDFRKIITENDFENSLFYLDPPYLPETRAAKKAYDNEMAFDDHVDLLDMIKNIKGKAILSGYDSVLYREVLGGWRLVKKEIANHSSQSKTKKRKFECLWMNY